MAIFSAMSVRAVFEVVPEACEVSIPGRAGPGSGFLVHVEVLKEFF